MKKINGPSCLSQIVMAVSLLLVPSQAVAKKRHNNKRDKAGVDFSIIKELPNVLSNPQDNRSFNGTVIIPPDPIVATGTQSVLVMVNSSLALYKKDTLELIFAEGTESFWQAPQGSIPGDVWCVFDEFAERFFLLAFNPFVNENDELVTDIYLAVSTDDEPQGSDDFFKYVFTAPNFADYPKMAVDEEAVYISTNDFNIEDELVASTIVAFAKQPLVTGSAPQSLTPVYREEFPVLAGEEGGFSQFFFPCQPRKRRCKEGVEKVVFARALVNEPGIFFAGNTIELLYIENVLTAGVARAATVRVPEFRGNDSATVPQPAPVIEPLDVPIIGIEVAQCVVFSGVVAGNSVWVTHNVFSDDGLDRTVARWYEFDVSQLISSQAAQLVQAGNADPGELTNQIWPSINADKDGNMSIQFTLVGEKQYPAIAYTGRLKDDPKGTVRLPLEVPIGGELYYQQDFGSGRNRYGDYSGLALDPCDHTTFWLFNEYPVAVNPGYAVDVSLIAEGVGEFPAIPATLSPLFSEVSGPGRLTDPLGACDPLVNNPDLTGQIGVMNVNFQCGSAEIVMNVEDANAEATVITGLPDGIVVGGNPGQTKPAVRLSFDDGQTLLEALQSAEEPIQITLRQETSAFPASYGSDWTTYLAAFQLHKSCQKNNAPQCTNLLTDASTKGREVFDIKKTAAKKAPREIQLRTTLPVAKIVE